MSFTIALMELSTKSLTYLPNAANIVVNVHLFDTARAQYTISGYDNPLQVNPVYTHDLIIWQDANALFRGRVNQVVDEMQGDEYTVSVFAVGYKDILDKRLILPEDLTPPMVVPTPDAARIYATADKWDASAIGWDLISLLQKRANGDMGITRAVNELTAPRTRMFPPGFGVSTAIDNLGYGDQTIADSTSTDIFEWDVIPDNDGNLEYHTWSPHRGKTEPTFTLDYGGTVSEFTRTVTGDDYYNQIYAYFPVSMPDVAHNTNRELQTAFDVVQTDSFYTDSAGELTKVLVVEGSTDTATKAKTDAQASQALFNQYALMIPEYTITLTSGAWRNMDDLWIGDKVNIQIKVGQLDDNISSYRCIGLSVSVGADGTTGVAVTIGSRKLVPTESLAAFARDPQKHLSYPRNRSAILGIKAEAARLASYNKSVADAKAKAAKDAAAKAKALRDAATKKPKK